jgi:hypothetical protein
MWLAVRESRATVLRVNPLVTYQIWQAATMGLSTLYIALTHSAEDLVPFGPRLVPLAQIAYGHAILVVGAFALYLGMKQFQPKEAITRSVGVRAPSAWELLTCFFAGTAILIFSDQITASMGSVFAGLSTMPLAVLSLFAIKPPAGLWRSRGAYWAVLMVGTVVLVLLNARDASKMMLSFSFVPLALASVRRKGTGVLMAFGIGFVALYLLVIAPLVGTTRGAVQMDDRGRRNVLGADAIGNVWPQLQSDFKNDLTQYLRTGLDSTMLRLCDPVAAGVVSDFVATGGLLRGAGMDYVPMAFIPRTLWHDKPIIERGRHFTAVLGQASDASSATSSSGQTAAGELFWNFSWPGVLIGMYLLGAAFSGAWWGADRGDPTSGVLEMTAFIGITLSFVVGVGSVAGGEFVTAIASGIVLRALIRARDLALRRNRGRYRGAVAAAPQIATCR